MHPLNLQERTILFLKELIHIFLEHKVQRHSMTFIVYCVASNYPISYHTEVNGCIFFATGVDVIYVGPLYIRSMSMYDNHENGDRALKKHDFEASSF